QWSQHTQNSQGLDGVNVLPFPSALRKMALETSGLTYAHTHTFSLSLSVSLSLSHPNFLSLSHFLSLLPTPSSFSRSFSLPRSSCTSPSLFLSLSLLHTPV